MAATMKSVVFWVVTLCSLEKARCFGGTHVIHVQCRSVNQSRNQQKQAESWA
jgi:hypothetical protein